MKDFFKITELGRVMESRSCFPLIGTEEVPLADTFGRILAEDLVPDIDLPDFNRSTMDGFAVRAASTFGASEGNPAFLDVIGTVEMGDCPDFPIGPGECARIATGGMLPTGADSVVMIEHTEAVDDTTIEVYTSLAPGTHMVGIGEDFKKNDPALSKGRKIRAQETGLLAAFGKESVRVYKKPVIGIISTGDELVPVNESPGPVRIRDINTYTLSGLAVEAGGIPLCFGIVHDDFDTLYEKCETALSRSDMVVVSGGSSVGMRDYTIEALSRLPGSHILAHGMSISPGKPTILAEAGNKAFWGLPGHVVSAMVVFSIIVRPFIEHIGGMKLKRSTLIPALLSRNLSSTRGRTDFVRVRLVKKEGVIWAEPVLGKSGLINTMVKADGLIEIGINTEGLNKGSEVMVIQV